MCGVVKKDLPISRGLRRFFSQNNVSYFWYMHVYYPSESSWCFMCGMHVYIIVCVYCILCMICIALCVFCIVYVYMVISHRAECDQPGQVANPASGQINRQNGYFPVPICA